MKKFLLVFLVLAASGLIWYLFFKKYDYEFQMEAKYGPGAVYYEISNWKNFSPESKRNDIGIFESEPFKYITQKVDIDSSASIEMFWELEKKNDTVTNISLSLRSSENELANRWAIVNPFESSVYIDTLKHRILEFRQRLKDIQNTYHIITENEIVRSPDMNCICHSSSNIPLRSKASEMLQTIGFLENYVLSRNIKLTGSPFVKVTKWDRENEVIDFDFCFPVNLAQDIKPSAEVDFREMKSFSALKAVYHGNYRLSHLAWYDLLNKAEEEDLKTNSLPMEIFFNNPKVESNSEDWKAEVFLPIVE